MADPQGAGMVQGGAGVAQRGGGLAANGGGERLRDRDKRLVLGVGGGPQVAQPGQGRLGGGGIAVQRRQPGPVAGQELDAGQRVGVGGLVAVFSPAPTVTATATAPIPHVSVTSAVFSPKRPGPRDRDGHCYCANWRTLSDNSRFPITLHGDCTGGGKARAQPGLCCRPATPAFGGRRSP
jgi:hypothetical protein